MNHPQRKFVCVSGLWCPRCAATAALTHRDLRGLVMGMEVTSKSNGQYLKKKTHTILNTFRSFFLAHLSQRLTGEPIGYP